MKKIMNLLFISIAAIGLNGCFGESLPSDNDDISEINLTDLQAGYVAKGVIDYELVEARFDVGFCNDVLTFELSGDLIDTYSGVTTYEITGDGIIVSSNGDVILDASTSGTLEEGKTYPIEYKGDNFDWQVGSISVMEECI